MQSSKLQKGNMITSRFEKQLFIAPGALGKGRGKGLRPSLRSSSRDALIGAINNSTSPNDTSTEQPNDASLPCEFESVEDIQSAEETTECDPVTSQKKRKVRGRNKCNKVAKLKNGEKLKVKFYNNRATGKNHKVFSRHLGKIVRDRNICPLRVHSWKEIEDDNKNHMWAAVTDKFELHFQDKFQNKQIQAYRDETLEHMNELWNKWRGDLHRKFIKPCKTIHDALKNVPPGVDREDWEWLVKEHFFGEKFLAASKRNSENRAKLSMPHRTGSKPFRQIIWKKGGKYDKPPGLATIFYETRKKGGQLEGEDINNKYNEILDATQSNPSFSNIELVETCFGSQCRNHVVCFGGGVKPSDLKPSCSSRAQLHAKLCETQKENESLKSRIDGMEVELQAIKEMLQQQFNAPPPPSRSEEQEIQS